MGVVLKQLLRMCPIEFRDKRDKHGWTPLHILASNIDSNLVRPHMIRTLCNANAEVDPVKKRGQTPLMCAVNTSHQAAAEMLIMFGADAFKENDEGTSLYDMAHHNKNVQAWVQTLGVGPGAGVSGTGRLASRNVRR